MDISNDTEAYKQSTFLAWSRTIINLTQHPATYEQIEAGVVDIPEDKKAKLVGLLTFEALPTAKEIGFRARKIANLAFGLAPRAMIGGAPYLMGHLELTLKANGIVPIYAFSKRESVEELVGGKVVKKSVFRHAGFIEVLASGIEQFV